MKKTILCLLTAVPALMAQNEMCPRPEIGAAVEEPASLRGRNGTLQLDFSFRTSLGKYGLRRFCYVTGDGVQAPTLRVQPGDELVIRLKNELPAAASAAAHAHAASCGGGMMAASSTNLHFHGLALPPVCHQDETLRTLIQPSDPPFEYRVRIPANEAPGLYWYHPHPHGFSEAQVLGGASGALIVEGIEKKKPEVAGLPERVLVLRDQPVPGINRSDEDAGPGKDISLNFVPVMYPLYRPAAMRVRPGQREFWRVLNASADTYFDLQVRFGSIIQDVNRPQAFELIAVDGVPIGGDGKRSDILLSPGARAEFIVTTPPIGTFGQLVTLNYDTGPDGAASPLRTIANLVADAEAPLPPRMPSVSRESATTLRDLSQEEPVRRRKFYFSEERGDPAKPGSARYYITEEGATPKVFEMNFKTPDIVVKQGTTEDWVIENRAQEAHSFHIHQLHFQLLERDGARVVEQMLRDTIDVPYWDGKSPQFPSVTLRMDFRDPNIIGTFVYHCHILEHEDGGMMGSVRVEK